jgi:hypothetical protein
MMYGKSYDFSKPFFLQMKELSRAVPWPALLNWNAVNSDYCVYTTDNKDCYLVFGGDYNENCFCATHNFHSKDSGELFWVEKCELCYELIYSENCFRVKYGRYVNNCTDCAFMLSCTNCTDCIGCVGLKNKSHCILNKQYSKEEYENKAKGAALDTRAGLEKFKRQFEELRLSQPTRFAEIYKSVGCTGDNIHSSKNCVNCFDVFDGAEDLKNAVLAGWGSKDGRNVNHFGHKSELVYDSLITFDNSQRVRFCASTSTSQDIEYSMNCRSSRNLFGCVNLRGKEYCILNKQYDKDSYEKTRSQIVEHMKAMPYKDMQGYMYTYGDFFPPELSLFAYNETSAQEYFPLTKEEALRLGYEWREAENREYTATKPASSMPDNIAEVDDSITKEVIGCSHNGECNQRCAKAFRIVPQELQLYRQLNVPPPILCPSCRHYERMSQKNPLKLWHRKCQCSGVRSENGVYQNTVKHFHEDGHCPNEFETSFAPERKEIVYCEQCYQTEVA